MKIEDLFTNKEMKPSEFVNALNTETILFQEAAAGALKAQSVQVALRIETRRQCDTGRPEDCQESVRHSIVEPVAVQNKTKNKRECTMQEELNHGPRLTVEEYERKIIELHSGLPPMPTKDQDRQVRQMELNLAIDHRLGRDFPPERREALWKIQQRVEKKRLWLALKYPFRRFFAKSLARDAQGLAGFLVDEYAKVLTQSELKSFFDLQEGQRPALPIDLNQLRHSKRKDDG